MKKIIAIVMLLALCLTLVACGGSKEAAPAAATETTTETTETAAANDGSSFGIDLTAEGMQKMAEEYATADTLKKVRDEYLGGNTMFKYSGDTRTYADFVEYIGVDASQYQFNGGERTYIWYADGDANSYFAATFGEEEGAFILYGSSAVNLG